MSLHKARPKKLEDLPDYCRCCEAVIKSIISVGELTLDLSTTKKSSTGNCNFCGATWPPDYTAVDQNGLRCELSFLDIDEAPCPPSL